MLEEVIEFEMKAATSGTSTDSGKAGGLFLFENVGGVLWKRTWLDTSDEARFQPSSFAKVNYSLSLDFSILHSMQSKYAQNIIDSTRTDVLRLLGTEIAWYERASKEFRFYESSTSL